MSTRACSRRAGPRGAAAPTVLALIIAVPLLLLAVPLLTLLHDLCVPDDRAVAWSPARREASVSDCFLSVGRVALHAVVVLIVFRTVLLAYCTMS